MERAKRAKEKAALEALEAQGLTAKPIATVNTPTSNGAAPPSTPSPISDDSKPLNQSSPSDQSPSTVTAPPDNIDDEDVQDPFSGY